MPAIRSGFLNDRRCSRVVLKDAATRSGLHYMYTKLDKRIKGFMNIHAIGMYFSQIQQQQENLPQIKVKYTGSGLPNIGLKLLLLPLKSCRINEYITEEKKHSILTIQFELCRLRMQGYKAWTDTGQRYDKRIRAFLHWLLRRENLNYLASHFGRVVYDSYGGNERWSATLMKYLFSASWTKFRNAWLYHWRRELYDQSPTNE